MCLWPDTPPCIHYIVMTQVLYHIGPQAFVKGEGPAKVLTDMAERDWLALTATLRVRQGTKSALKIKIPGGRMNQAVGKGS